jgi:hypothetical protein
VFTFKTDLPVQRGDRLGLVAIEGSALGARSGVHGATTDRWIPNIAGSADPTNGPGSGFDKELLLRVEYLPGGEQRLPHQVSGAAAAKLGEGQVESSHPITYTNGTQAQIELVRVGGRYVLDERIDDRRTARIDVPGFIPDHGDVITFDVYAEDEGAGLGIYMEYVATNSARVQNHFYAAFPHEFQFVN